MNISIQPKSGIPIYEQIENQLRECILSKELKQGDMLPSIRSLAKDLKISVITTKRAYEELETEGLVYSVAGKGFYVDDPDVEYLEDKKVKGIEEQVEAVLKVCQQANLSKEDVLALVDLLWEEE